MTYYLKSVGKYGNKYVLVRRSKNLMELKYEANQMQKDSDYLGADKVYKIFDDDGNLVYSANQ
jgi:hypothetical protein